MDSIFDQRVPALKAFAAKAGWGDADWQPLGQDASTRRYIRLTRGGETAMLMDAPPVESMICHPADTAAQRLAKGWNASTRLAASRVDAFVLIAGHLQARGLSAPKVFAHDSAAGMALIEDFGASLEFARLIERGEQDEVALYTAAAEALAHLHRDPAPAAITSDGESWPILEFDALLLCGHPVKPLRRMAAPVR